MKRPSGFSGEADPPQPHQIDDEPQVDAARDAVARAQPSVLWSKLTKKRNRDATQSDQAAEHVGLGGAASSDPRDMHATQPLNEALSRVAPIPRIGVPTPQDDEPSDGHEPGADSETHPVTTRASLRRFVSRSRDGLTLGRKHNTPENSLDVTVPGEAREAKDHEISGLTGTAILPDSVLNSGADLLRSDDRVEAAVQEVKRAERARKAQERRDQRRFSAPSRTRKRNWLLSIGAVVVLAVTVLIGVFSPLMAVRTVDIAGAEMVNVKEIQTALARFEGVPLALVGDQDLHRALEPFPLIQRYSVERIPPSTLRVQIEERQPVIAIALDSGFRLVDAAGVLTGEVPELPPGILRASGGILDTSSAAFAAAAPVIRDMPEDIRMMMAEVAASGEQDIQFVLHSGVTIVWGDNTATQRKAVVTRAMLAAVPGAARIDISAPEAPVFQ